MSPPGLSSITPGLPGITGAWLTPVSITGPHPDPAATSQPGLSAPVSRQPYLTMGLRCEGRRWWGPALMALWGDPRLLLPQLPGSSAGTALGRQTQTSAGPDRLLRTQHTIKSLPGTTCHHTCCRKPWPSNTKKHTAVITLKSVLTLKEIHYEQTRLEICQQCYVEPAL